MSSVSSISTSSVSSSISDISSTTSTSTSSSTSTTSTTSTTDRRAALQGALFITPIPLSSLEPDALTCPICQEPYADCPSPTSFTAADESDTGEWAVSIDMVAEWFGPKKCCGHIMGKNCLQAHVTSNGPWKHKCPLCRDVWYHAVAPEKARRFVEEEEEEEPQVLRRSARIARMEAAREGSVTAQASMSQRHGVFRATRRERQQFPSQARAASAAFSSQLMAALQVEEGGKHVHGSLEEIKERLSALYSGLER